MAGLLPPSLVRLLRGLWERFRDADLGINAAAVAYNAFLALVPLGIALLGAAAFVGGDQDAMRRVESTLAVLAPAEVVDFVVDLLREADARIGGQQGWLIPVSVLVALVLGSRAVAALQKALARAENRTERRPPFQLRLVAVLLTVAGGIALLITSFLLVGGARLITFLEELSGLGFLSTVWTWLRVPVSAAGLFLFLLAFYQWGPPEPLPRAWMAALVATAGALLASLGFGWFLSATPDMGTTFGILGAVAVALVWLYLGTFAILLGAVVVLYLLRQRATTR